MKDFVNTIRRFGFHFLADVVEAALKHGGPEGAIIGNFVTWLLLHPDQWDSTMRRLSRENFEAIGHDKIGILLDKLPPDIQAKVMEFVDVGLNLYDEETGRKITIEELMRL